MPEPPRASPSRVAVDENAVEINDDWSWVYTGIDLDSWLILDVAVFGWRGTDSAAPLLHQLTEKHYLSEAVFLGDQFVYRTALARLGLNGRVNYTDRNLIEKLFHPLKCVLTVSITHEWAVGGALDSATETIIYVDDYVVRTNHCVMNYQGCLVYMQSCKSGCLL